MAESKKELKSVLMRVKEDSERAGLRLNIKKSKITASAPHYCMAKRSGKGGSSDRFPLRGLQNHCGWWLQPWNQKMTASWQESCDKPRQCVEKQRHYSADKGPYRQDYGLLSVHVWLWELDHREGKVPKNWCLRTVVLEKTPESPLDSQEIKAVNLKGSQPWILVARTDDEAEAPAFWSSDVNRWLTRKVPDAGKDWGRRGHQRMRQPDSTTNAWTRTWANSGRWWGMGRPGVLQSVGLQRVRHDSAPKQQPTTAVPKDPHWKKFPSIIFRTKENYPRCGIWDVKKDGKIT